MSSLIEGYNYDIFISYRHNDNKYDGWVTEFAGNLKKELDATFKEKLSVYFDSDPYEGLLETDTVDRSLETKLNCLIFIPVVSRTYCDQLSYAWNSEFMAFIKAARKDAVGLDVRLRNGNVASRILPVRIHEIKPDDCKLIEETLGHLRAIDFIYKAPGVNRPLRSNEDHPHDNLNRTYYRDQINKVANAIDEIITGIKIQLKDDSFLITPVMKSDNQPSYLKGEKYIKSLVDTKNLRKIGYSLFVLVVIISFILNWNNIFSKRYGKEREIAKTHVETAVSYFNNHDYDAAERETRLAMQYDPGYSYAWSTLAAISVSKGDLNSAIVQTIEAVKFDPENHEAAYNMAYALEDKKDYIQAAEWYSKSIQIDSGFVPAYSALARMYNLQNRPIDAILLLGKVNKKFALSEYSYLIYKHLGNAYLIQGLGDSAIKYLELSSRLVPEEAETSLFLAKAYESSGEISKSIDTWQNYIMQEIDTIKIREARDHVKEITLKHLKKILGP